MTTFKKSLLLTHYIVDEFNYATMDTEFFGVILRLLGSFKNINDYNYQTLKDNVDIKHSMKLSNSSMVD